MRIDNSKNAAKNASQDTKAGKAMRFVLRLKDEWTCFWETLFPRTCPVCGRRLLADEDGWCLLCDRDMPLTHFWDWRNNPAEKRLWARTYLQAVYSLFYFNNSNDYPKLIYRIKYGGGQQLARLAGRRLGSYLLAHQGEAGWTGIVPVPLHPRKRRQRGYNQAKWIALGLSDVLNLPVYPHLLRRKRYTRTQTKVDPQHKWENVSGSFKVQHRHIPPDLLTEPNRAPGSGPYRPHLLLVDDVLTTGATLEACSEALHSSLPSSVRISVATLGFVGEV